MYHNPESPQNATASLVPLQTCADCPALHLDSSPHVQRVSFQSDTITTNLPICVLTLKTSCLVPTVTTLLFKMCAGVPAAYTCRVDVGGQLRGVSSLLSPCLIHWNSGCQVRCVQAHLHLLSHLRGLLNLLTAVLGFST